MPVLPVSTPEARGRGGRRAALLLLALVLLGSAGSGPCMPPPDPGGPEGALVVVPLLTGGHGRIADDAGVTVASFTNVLTVPVRLLVQVVSGDPGEQWRSDSFHCDLIARATATFTIAAAGGGSLLTAECFDLGFFGLPETITISARAANGIVVAAAADPDTNQALAANAILAEAVIVDVGMGFAFPVPAVRARAGPAGNDGDQIYRFDGGEYGQLPAGVESTVRSPVAGDFTELVLFTLDGTPGLQPPPRVALSGLGRFERQTLPFGPPSLFGFDFSWAFDCFDVVDLLSLSSQFAGFTGTDGYLQLVAQQVGTPFFDAHDAVFGDGNSSRRRPVLGWVLEKRGAVTSGRLLDPLPLNVMPFLNDLPPVFDADIFN